MDRLVRKGLELDAVDDVLEIYENALWLMYFPHSSVSQSLYETLKQQDDADKTSRLAKALETNPFIKFENEADRETVIGQLKEVNSETG